MAPPAAVIRERYHELGGWLLYLFIGAILATLFNGATFIRDLAYIVNPVLGKASNQNIYWLWSFGGIYQGAALVAMLGTGASAVGCAVTAFMLQTRDPRVRLWFIVSSIVSVMSGAILDLAVVMYLSYVNRWGVPVASTLNAAIVQSVLISLAALIVLIFWLLYFKKSKRVEVYFGTNLPPQPDQLADDGEGDWADGQAAQEGEPSD